MRAWLDLKGAAEYASLSVRTLRNYIGHAERPLPVRLVGGKWLCHVSDLDAWLRSFPRAGERVDQIVSDLMKELGNE